MTRGGCRCGYNWSTLDYRTAREPSEPSDTGSIDGKPTATPPVLNQPAVSSPQNPYKARDALRTLTF